MPEGVIISHDPVATDRSRATVTVVGIRRLRISLPRSKISSSFARKEAPWHFTYSNDDDKGDKGRKKRSVGAVI